MRVGPGDIRTLRLRREYKWYWCALPPTSVQTGMMRSVPNVRDVVLTVRRPYRVVRIGRMVDPKRGLGIVALQ